MHHSNKFNLIKMKKEKRKLLFIYFDAHAILHVNGDFSCGIQCCFLNGFRESWVRM